MLSGRSLFLAPCRPAKTLNDYIHDRNTARLSLGERMTGDLVTVLLDTNVFVAAYWAKMSASARLIRACTACRVQAQYSREVKREVLSTLRTIKVAQSYTESLELFWQKAEEVRGVPVESTLCEDPDDQKFLEAALGGQTDFLVTNDDHLLRLGHIGRAEILTPGSVVRVLGI